MHQPNKAEPIATDSALGIPAWRIALFFPTQGTWSESEYLDLSGGPLVEFDDGHIEVLDMPTKAHQRMVQFIYRLLHAFVTSRQIGEVFIAPLPTRLWAAKFREPDVLFLRNGRAEYQGNYPDGADLVVEVVGEGVDNRRRDLQAKRLDYAKAGINEYWIIDAELQSISVLCLDGDAYRAAGEYRRGESAAAVELPGFEVAVAACLDSATGLIAEG